MPALPLHSGTAIMNWTTDRHELSRPTRDFASLFLLTRMLKWDAWNHPCDQRSWSSYVFAKKSLDQILC